LKGNDYLLLATDGVWDVFSNDDIVPFINKHLLTPGGINEIGNLIIQEARRRHSSDNIAVVLIII
jgi:protein phosphatase 2C family protein 2/3